MYRMQSYRQTTLIWTRDPDSRHSRAKDCERVNVGGARRPQLGTFCFVQVTAWCLVGLCRPLFRSSHYLMSDRFVQAIVSSLVFDWSCPRQCFVPVTTRFLTGCVQAIVSSQSLGVRLVLSRPLFCHSHYLCFISLSRPLFRPSHYLVCDRFVQAIVSLQSLFGVRSVVSCRIRFRNFRRSPRSKWWYFLRTRIRQWSSFASWPRGDCKAGSHGWAATPSACTHTPSKAWSTWWQGRSPSTSSRSPWTASSSASSTWHCAPGPGILGLGSSSPGSSTAPSRDRDLTPATKTRKLWNHLLTNQNPRCLC